MKEPAKMSDFIPNHFIFLQPTRNESDNEIVDSSATSPLRNNEGDSNENLQQSKNQELQVTA